MDTIVIISVILFVILFLFTPLIQWRQWREEKGGGNMGNNPILIGSHWRTGTRTHTLYVCACACPRIVTSQKPCFTRTSPTPNKIDQFRNPLIINSSFGYPFQHQIRSLLMVKRKKWGKVREKGHFHKMPILPAYGRTYEYVRP
jgi:hypothetical protein